MPALSPEQAARLTDTTGTILREELDAAVQRSVDAGIAYAAAGVGRPWQDLELEEERIEPLNEAGTAAQSVASSLRRMLITYVAWGHTPSMPPRAHYCELPLYVLCNTAEREATQHVLDRIGGA